MIINTFYACNLGVSEIPFAVPAVGRASYAAVPVTGRYWSASAEHAGKLYLFGGDNIVGSFNACRSYDWATNLWAVLANLPGGIDTHVATARNVTSIERVGGTALSSRHDRYNIGANTWATAFSMGTLVSNAGGALVRAANGRLYIVGGTDPNGCYSYDPANNGAGWTQHANMPRNRTFPTAQAIGGKIYVMGDTAPTIIDIYDIATDAWTTGAAAAATNTYPFSAQANGFVYLFSSGTTPAQRYNPALNTWLTLAPAPVPVRQAGIQHVGDGLILSAGGLSGAAVVANTQGYVDFQGSLIGAPFDGVTSGTDTVTNITTGAIGPVVPFSAGDVLGFRVNAWNTVCAAKSTTLVAV